MTHYQLYQRLYGTLTSIPYDRTNVQAARVILYQILNRYGIDVKAVTKDIKSQKRSQKATAEFLSKLEPNVAAARTMATLCFWGGVLGSHICAAPEEYNPAQFVRDVMDTLHTLAALEKLPTHYV